VSRALLILSLSLYHPACAIRRDKRVGNWRDFQEAPDAKKVKAASYKEEIRAQEKHGVVKLETWKKKWK
jgi:hypothetical protein